MSEIKCVQCGKPAAFPESAEVPFICIECQKKQGPQDYQYALNLLAVVHCDGGHYTAAYGVRKSTDDAVEIVCGMKNKLASGPFGTEKLVCADITARQLHGIKKYGQTVEDNPLPLSKWLQHAYEEALDMAIYLKRAQQEQAKKEGATGGIESVGSRGSSTA